MKKVEELEEEEEKPVKVVAKYELVKVPTQYGLGIQTPNGEVMSPDEALVECLNLLREIKKAVA